MERAAVWLAPLERALTGLATFGGIGRIPWTPGTWGSLVGLLIGLWWPVHGVAGFVAVGLGFLLGVVVSGAAARAAGTTDPREVVIDEVWAMWAMTVLDPLRLLHIPVFAVIAFVLFRACDVLKPFPIRRLERLPGGWGIMVDDLVALGYAVLGCGLLLWLWASWPMRV